MKKQFLALLLALMLTALCAVPAMADGAMETINFENGDVYVGEVVNGEPNGVGTYTLASGKVYHGEFVDGYFEGTGVYMWVDGMIYVGEFVHDRIEGKGMVKYADGEYYIGSFANNKCHGFGTYFAADGTVIESGVYEAGTFIGSTAETPAVQTAPAGLTEDFIVGTWVLYSMGDGESELIAAEAGIDSTMTFNADGTCKMTLNGDNYSDTWSLDSEDSMLVMGGDSHPIVDGEIHLDLGGVTAVFIRP